MKTFLKPRIFPLAWPVLLFPVLPVIGLSGQEGNDREAAQRHFTLKVLPLLTEKCFPCHGDDPEDIEGGLVLNTREDMLLGGDGFGNVVVPGKAEESFMMTAVQWKDPDYEMPPKENDRLTGDQIADLRAWIDAGAPWPDEETQRGHREDLWSQEVTEDGVLVKTIGGLSDAWTYRRYPPEKIWAFQPVSEVEPPLSSGNPVDAFVDAKIREKSLTPAPPADPVTLIRRATYDLHGLPPSPEEVQTFVEATAADPEGAWESLIDRLLASPHYGERMAQHWLDVVRYADTSGYSNDWERSNAWRFRDYVIRSFNADKPYRRFIMEQVAGDEMDPDDPEMIVAAGFLRMGPWEHTSMTPERVSRQLYLDDVVNSVGQTFLSTAMRCVKCHDHKFDPIPAEDYYRMYAAFATTQPVEREAAYIPEENISAFELQREEVQTLLDFAEEKLAVLKEIEEGHARDWFAENNLEYVGPEERKELPDDQKPPRHYRLTPTDEGRIKIRQQDIRIWTRAMERFEPLAQSVYNGGDLNQKSERLRPARPGNKAEMEAVRKLPENFIYTGGNVFSRGKPVSPGVLSALGLPTDYGSNEDPFALPPV